MNGKSKHLITWSLGWKKIHETNIGMFNPQPACKSSQKFCAAQFKFLM